MRVIFEGEVRADHGHFFLDSRPEQASGDVVDLSDAFAGQCSGLCGAAFPGFLYMLTGLRFGGVGLRMERHEEAPAPPGAGWEEVAEVSFEPRSDDTVLLAGDGQEAWPLALGAVPYRVRHCVTGMDAGNAADQRSPEEPLIERWLMQWWPAPAAPDAVLRQTSDVATRSHRWAGEQRPLSRPATRPLSKARAWEVERERAERSNLLWRGGGRPSEPLARMEGAAVDLVRVDRQLAEAVAAADAATQRAIARWAARLAFTAAGLAEVDWIAPALAALDRQEEFPPPFPHRHLIWERILDDARIRHTSVAAWNGYPPDIVQQQAALPALRQARGEDALRAAVETLVTAMAVSGPTYRTVLTSTRRAFPHLTT
jgi:hypothetical protein